MKDSREQQGILDFCKPYEKAKQFLEEGETLFPWVWQAMIERNSVTFVEVIELAEIALEKGIYLPEEVLIFLLRHQPEIEDRGLIKRIFTKKQENPVIKFFELYHEKHPEVRWSDALVMEALEHPNFKELFLRFQFSLSPEAEVLLVQRRDFISIINDWPWKHFWLCEEAQMELVNQPFDKLSAYVQKAYSLNAKVVDSFIASDEFTCEKAFELFENIKELYRSLSKDAIHQLLAQKNRRITELVVGSLPHEVTLELEDQKLILATPIPSASIDKYARLAAGSYKARVFDVSLQAQVLQILQEQAPKALTGYVNCLLTSDAEHLNAEFVTWLSQQPADFISGLCWKHRKLNTCSDFWINTLATTKATLFMKEYKNATLNNGHRDPDVNVIIKMMELPNAPELVAIWDRQAGEHVHTPYGSCRPQHTYDDNQYWWGNGTLDAMLKLPEREFMAIYGIASRSLKQKLDRRREECAKTA